MTKKFSYTFNSREELGSQQPSEIVVYREEHLLEPEDRFHGLRSGRNPPRGEEINWELYT